MHNHQEIRLAGSGGQGVILATIILAEAGFLAGENVAQSQSYGPEARGGMCKAEVIIDDDAIHYTKVEKPDVLLALTQVSLDKYISELAPGAVIIADASLAIPTADTGHRILSIPILATAVEEVGRAVTANIVAVGAINAALHLVPDDILEKAVLMHVPKGTEPLNLKALEAGKKLIA